MLQDDTYYEEARQYQLHEAMKALTDLIYPHRGCQTSKEYDYLTDFICKTSNLYGLPKYL